MKIKISVEIVNSTPDLRQKGSNIFTGRRAVYLVNGKKRYNNIYMTNTGSSLWFYVKNKGINVALQSEDIIYNLHTHHLTNKLWYIEK